MKKKCLKCPFGVEIPDDTSHGRVGTHVDIKGSEMMTKFLSCLGGCVEICFIFPGFISKI